MTKKEVKQKESKKKVLSKAELEQTLIDNFTNLQKVLTNLTVKFDELSNNLTKMFELFEISAKTFAEKYSGETTNAGVDTEFLKKLDSLLDQNKTIAKGIMLMEEKVRERSKIPTPHNIGMRLKPLPRY